MAETKTIGTLNREILWVFLAGMGLILASSGVWILQPQDQILSRGGWLAGIGISLSTILLWLRSRPGDQLVIQPEAWALHREEADHYRLQATFVARNENPIFEVTLAQVNPRVHVLSNDSIQDIQTNIQLRSLHSDMPARPDNYWQAYIISPQSQTRLELELDLRGANLDHLQSCWVELDYIQYGRQLRTPKTSHLIVPLQMVEPLSNPTWQSKGDVQLLPIPTHLLSPSDRWPDVIRRYVQPQAKPGDYIAISETAAAVVQGHLRHPTDVKPGWVARRLCYAFPSKTSLSSSYGLQSLIDESGVWRVLRAFVIGSVAKVVGIPGVFYELAGEQAALIDDVTGTLPPYDQFIVLGPRQPEQLVNEIKAATGQDIAIVDANDLGEVKILAATAGVKPELVIQALGKNPAGNSAEQTPIVLIRPQTEVNHEPA